MHDLYLAWQQLLDRHSQLLCDLEQGLQRERKALLANDLDLLREASLSKEKASRHVFNIQDEIEALKSKSIEALGLEANLDLASIFQGFDKDQGRNLLNKRTELLRKSKAVNRINQFNNKCLHTYLDYVEGIRSVFSLCKVGEYQTYSFKGKTQAGDYNGRMIDRSL